MSRFNKKAIYQMAGQSNLESRWPDNGIKTLPPTAALPDGRLASKLVPAQHSSQVFGADGITVSPSAHGTGPTAVSRSQVRQRLGNSQLSHLVSAYLEQQIMVDEESHRTQEIFYGLNGLRAV